MEIQCGSVKAIPIRMDGSFENSFLLLNEGTHSLCFVQDVHQGDKDPSNVHLGYYELLD
jgi:hypothetical protein